MSTGLPPSSGARARLGARHPRDGGFGRGRARLHARLFPARPRHCCRCCHQRSSCRCCRRSHHREERQRDDDAGAGAGAVRGDTVLAARVWAEPRTCRRSCVVGGGAGADDGAAGVRSTLPRPERAHPECLVLRRSGALPLGRRGGRLRAAGRSSAHVDRVDLQIRTIRSVARGLRSGLRPRAPVRVSTSSIRRVRAHLGGLVGASARDGAVWRRSRGGCGR